MRLQRHGKKGQPFYHIVIADGRAPRDGRYIEKIGSYNPIPDPAEIVLNFEKALDWLQKGAQPTDTVRAILSYKGVLYKNHLIKGMKKGALTEAEVEAKFQAWLKDKEAKIEAKRSGLAEKARADRKAILEAETKIKEERAAELAKKRAEEIEAQVQEAKAAATEEEAAEETPAVEEEEMVTKEAVEAKVEEIAQEEAKAEEERAEAKEEEKPAEEEKTEEPVAEEKAEEPKEEAKAEEEKAEAKEEKAEAKEEEKKDKEEK
jgi:small subunit ribosomal protein S16